MKDEKAPVFISPLPPLAANWCVIDHQPRILLRETHSNNCDEFHAGTFWYEHPPCFLSFQLSQYFPDTLPARVMWAHVNSMRTYSSILSTSSHTSRHAPERGPRRTDSGMRVRRMYTPTDRGWCYVPPRDVVIPSSDGLREALHGRCVRHGRAPFRKQEIRRGVMVIIAALIDRQESGSR